MSNIIYCDFKRTERRKEMAELHKWLSQIVQLTVDKPLEPEEEQRLVQEIQEKENRFLLLKNEERKWGLLKWGK